MAVARLRLLLLLVFAIGGRAELPDEDDLDDDDYGPPPPPSPAGHSSGDHGSSCSFKLSTGESFDLSPMKREEHDFTGTTTGGYTYRFNVCGNTVKLCNAQPAPASKWRGTKCNNLGDPATQRVSLLDSTDPSKGVRLTYTQGDICKRQVDGQMEIGSRLINYDVRRRPDPAPPSRPCEAVATPILPTDVHAARRVRLPRDRSTVTRARMPSCA